MYMDCVIVEDETRMARRYRDNAGLGKILNTVTIIGNMDDAIDHITANPNPKVYWIDLNLGNGQNEGINILRYIKEKASASLVIVYTVYREAEPLCRAIGLQNFAFIEKYAPQMEEDLKTIETLIINYKNQVTKAKNVSVESYPALVSNVSRAEGIVKLICFYKGLEIDRFVKLSTVEAAYNRDVKVDDWVLVTVTEQGAATELNFTKIDAPRDINTSLDDFGINDEEYLNSNFWKTK